MKRLRAGVVLLALFLPVVRAEEPPATDAFSRALSDTARRLQEDLPPDPTLWALLESGGPLWAARLRFAAAADALADGDRRALDASKRLPDGTLLGLPGLEELLRLRAEGLATAGPSGASTRQRIGGDLLSLAARSAPGPVGRAALFDASLLVEGAGPRKRLLEECARLLPPSAAGPRAAIRRNLVLARAMGSDTSSPTTVAALTALAEQVPDAPERAPDLFTARESKAFAAAVAGAPLAVRAARARTLASRHPDEAAALVLRGSGPYSARVAATEVLVLASHGREASQEVARLLPEAPTEADRLHLRSLAASAALRTVRGRTSPGTVSTNPARGGSKGAAPRGKKRAPRGRAPAPVDPAARRAAWDAAAADAVQLLAAPLAEEDRRRLLGELARAGSVAGDPSAALGFAAALVASDPASTAGAVEVLDAAFSLYRAGSWAEAANLWGSASVTWRDAAVRRRATYWQARAKLKSGDEAGARPLFASLVTGTAPDLWGRWSAAWLGVPFPAPPAAPIAEGGLAPLDASTPGSPERELLACGLPDLAEEEAEVAGSSSPLLLAATASARGDHRRAASILKTRWPALGTSEEGDVPEAARRAFYPAAHRERLEEAARAAGVPPALLFGLVRQESVFSPGIVSRSGAVGLTQVMPATGRLLNRQVGEKGRPDLANPDTNARLGAKYLGDMLRQFGGDSVLALAAYNAGPGRAARWRREMGSLPEDEFVESIPLTETRDYVRRVLFYEASYAAIWGLSTTTTGAPAGAVAPDVRVKSPF